MLLCIRLIYDIFLKYFYFEGVILCAPKACENYNFF